MSMSNGLCAETPNEAMMHLAIGAAHAASAFDPTPFSGIVIDGLPQALTDIENNGQRRRQESRINPHNLRLKQSQDFLLEPTHPDRLASLDLRTEGGVKVPVADALRSNPEYVLSRIRELGKAVSSDPQRAREVEGMLSAAEQFVRLEERMKQPALQSTLRMSLK